jgi:hypothetical protein
MEHRMRMAYIVKEGWTLNVLVTLIDEGEMSIVGP